MMMRKGMRMMMITITLRMTTTIMTVIAVIKPFIEVAKPVTSS